MLSHLDHLRNILHVAVHSTNHQMLHAGSIAFAVLPDGSSARAAGCGPAFLDGGCGYDLGELKHVRPLIWPV